MFIQHYFGCTHCFSGHIMQACSCQPFRISDMLEGVTYRGISVSHLRKHLFLPSDLQLAPHSEELRNAIAGLHHEGPQSWRDILCFILPYPIIRLIFNSTWTALVFPRFLQRRMFADFPAERCFKDTAIVVRQLLSPPQPDSLGAHHFRQAFRSLLMWAPRLLVVHGDNDEQIKASVNTTLPWLQSCICALDLHGHSSMVANSADVMR